MNKTAVVTGIILTVSCLIACSEETHTVAWYKEHPEILAKEVEKCKVKTLAELVTDKHCQVIQQAQQEVLHEHQRDAPLPNIKFK